MSENMASRITAGAWAGPRKYDELRSVGRPRTERRIVMRAAYPDIGAGSAP